jgi:hypothetical protein
MEPSTTMIGSNSHQPTQYKPSTGHSLTEYLLIATILSGLGLAGIVGFNGGFQAVLTKLNSSLLQGGASPITSQTNQDIAAAQVAVKVSTLPALLPEVSGGSAAKANSQSSAPPPTEQLTTLNTLLSSMDPTNLPEVSGSNSNVDIAAILSSANTLVEQAKALEAAQAQNTGLNVSELVFQARKLAVSQFFLASVATEGTPPRDTSKGTNGSAGPYSDKGRELLALLIAQKPNDADTILLYQYYMELDYINHKPGIVGQVQQITVGAENYRAAYQPLASTISQLNIQTQQAQTVVTNGGNINNNANVNGNANQTLKDANAINACQSATCN